MPSCRIAKIVSEEMIRLKCKRVLHPFSSRNLAIANFYLFGVLKQQLQGIDVSDDEELKNEILMIFQDIPSDEPKTSPHQWIERCQWVAPNAGN
jgi:hypothetical protein